MKQRKTVKLIVDHDFQFSLLGISSHENDYRLSWVLNNLLKTKLTRTGPLSIRKDKNSDLMQFSVSHFSDDECFLSIHLISNRSSDGYLFDVYKNLDFFLKISGEDYEEQSKMILEKLKASPDISFALLLDLNQMKNKQWLIF